MTDARFGPGLRAVLTTPEHSAMMDTIEENLAKWIERFNSYKEQNQQDVIETTEQGSQTACVLITLANEDNLSATPAVIRALHETSCVTCYMAEEIVPRLRKARVNDVHRLLWRLDLGTNRAKDYGSIRPIQPASLNRAAERWMWPTSPMQTTRPQS